MPTVCPDGASNSKTSVSDFCVCTRALFTGKGIMCPKALLHRLTSHRVVIPDHKNVCSTSYTLVGAVFESLSTISKQKFCCYVRRWHSLSQSLFQNSVQCLTMQNSFYLATATDFCSDLCLVSSTITENALCELSLELFVFF